MTERQIESDSDRFAQTCVNMKMQWSLVPFPCILVTVKPLWDYIGLYSLNSIDGNSLINILYRIDKRWYWISVFDGNAG